MKMRLLAGAAFATLFAASGAFAQEALPGWYVAADVGAHEPETVKVSGLAGANAIPGQAFDTDVAAFGRIGYRIDPHWRVEVEGGYRPGEVKGSSESGHFNSASGMVNVLYDILPDSKLQPFVGAGVGANVFRIKESSPTTFITDKSADFAWQGIAGASYAVSD